MIRSFQRKITLLVLGFLLVILAGVVFAINYVNWKDLTDQAQYSLEVIVNNNGRRPGMHFRQDEAFPPPWLQEQQRPEEIGEAAYETEEAEDDADEDDLTDYDEDDEDDLDYGNNYEDFLDGENRYAALKITFPENAEKLFKQASDDAMERYKTFKKQEEM